ncbi:tafazzin [Microdochium bolleyi]|uniref:Tafazzin n=1 Tax=Microdochium bolleyi TaxID=196109 RepID=A0A136JEN3_9PEZI|nr:tafazzin [Microdochium bolleyi]
MPKKRHPTQYTKPPTTAPASLSLSSSSPRNADRHERSVNEILANLRRSTLNSTPNPALQSQLHTSPSVPPNLRNILQLPESPAPAPRRLQRRFINGRRGPPGPPPPRSWVSLTESRRATCSGTDSFGGKNGVASSLPALPLPGAYYPEDQSLVAMTLRRMAADWAQQRDWNRFYLYTLPSRLRTALIAYLSEFYDAGITARDLRLILIGPPNEELETYKVAPPDLAIINDDVTDLDLAGSIGRSVSIKELGDILFPAQKPTETEPELLDSWDAPSPTAGPARLLPNLTRLSLAVEPTASKPPSWKHLLAIASKLNTVTHLSLVGWPEPSFTPNAKHTKVISPTTGQAVQYGGTGTYSHTLDGDWTEATLMLRRLSGRMYSLEHLDLSGCADWFPALRHVVRDAGDAECVDWAGDWGKVRTLRLTSGYALPEDATLAQVTRFDEWVRSAAAVERHIGQQRGGRGKWITVERDVLPERAKKMLEWEALQQTAR